MLLGLPVVALENPTSPIRHEVNGLVAKTAKEMSLFVQHLAADQDLRTRLGNAARDTVLREFSPQAFWAVWTQVIRSAKAEGDSV